MFFFGFNFFRGLGGLLALPLAVWAAIWAYRDAARRGYSEWLWAGIAFSLFPLGLLAYVVYRALAGVRDRI
ncbi:MAG: hypothetical protein ACM3X6_04080 [Patescibacteria group bacterium]